MLLIVIVEKRRRNRGFSFLNFSIIFFQENFSQCRNVSLFKYDVTLWKRNCCHAMRESQFFNSQFSTIIFFVNDATRVKTIETFSFIIHSYESFLFFDWKLEIWTKSEGNGSFLEKFDFVSACIRKHCVLWVALISCFRNLSNLYPVNCLSCAKLYLASN